MSTLTRPVLSKKNEYFIEKHRYYELKHFCLQYPIWIEAKKSLDSMAINPLTLEAVSHSNISDPVARCQLAREKYDKLITTVERAAQCTDEFLAYYILKAVTENKSYESLRTLYMMPCSRDIYYKMYRKFFWILNKIRE